MHRLFSDEILNDPLIFGLGVSVGGGVGVNTNVKVLRQSFLYLLFLNPHMDLVIFGMIIDVGPKFY